MKVIDLLNKMAKDKSFRPTIKIFSTTYKYNERIGDYENDENSEWGVFSDYTINNILNDEVELIEDEIDIDNIKELNVGDALNNKITRNKINELVQAVKQLDKKLKEK